MSLSQMPLALFKSLPHWLTLPLFPLACFFLQADESPGGRFQKVCTLPSPVTESSGLVVVNANAFWTLNDSGNDPVLYHFDSTGNLLQSRPLTNATNTDWESLTHKGDTLFIGDFGNNLNSRTNLGFWEVPPDSQTATFLPFAYPDQAHFPPPHSNWNFDAEGSFYWEGSLYWFSKTRVRNPAYTKLYRMRAAPEAKAELLDSFQIDGMITGADISQDGRTVVLMSYGKAYRLQPFNPQKLAAITIQSISLPKTQTEAIAFLNERVCYMTDEQANLYKLPLNLFETR